mmetsp:Transcript_14900/g.41037  ORF Transcript_14900/g.41037 Transcript_14900/m.41037 type:complete len:147 (-) Transcript_14900:316-756(-)
MFTLRIPVPKNFLRTTLFRTSAKMMTQEPLLPQARGKSQAAYSHLWVVGRTIPCPLLARRSTGGPEVRVFSRGTEDDNGENVIAVPKAVSVERRSFRGGLTSLQLFWHWWSGKHLRSGWTWQRICKILCVGNTQSGVQLSPDTSMR